MNHPEELESLRSIFEKLADEKVVIVQFHHSFCYACQNVKPHFLKLSSRYQEQAAFYRVELGEVTEAIDHFNISQIPTFIAFYKTEEIRRYIGQKKALLSQFIMKSLETKKVVAESAADKPVIEVTQAKQEEGRPFQVMQPGK